jgi:hypothetical protein
MEQTKKELATSHERTIGLTSGEGKRQPANITTLYVKGEKRSHRSAPLTNNWNTFMGKSVFDQVNNLLECFSFT